jgi:hypothetical protein
MKIVFAVVILLMFSCKNESFKKSDTSDLSRNEQIIEIPIGKWNNNFGRPAIVFKDDKVLIYSEMIDNEINNFLEADLTKPYELYINENNISAGQSWGGNTHWGCRIDIYYHLLSNNILLLIVKNYYYLDDWETYFEKEHTYLLVKD